MTEVVIRPSETAEPEHVKWALYKAASWGQKRALPPYEVTIEHPELAR